MKKIEKVKKITSIYPLSIQYSFFLIGLCVFMFSCTVKNDLSNPGNTITKDQTIRVANWEEDLNFLKEQFEAEHFNLFRLMTQKEWDRSFDQLTAKIPQLKDHEVITEAMKIISRVGDGHTSIYVPFQGEYQFHQIPIAFQDFKDGVFIKGAASQYKDVVGKELISIGGVPISKVKQRLRTITPKDNDQWIKVLGIEVYMTIPEILYALNLTDDILNVTLEVKDSDNNITTEKIAAELFDINKVRFLDVRPDWITAHDASPNPLPLYLKRINNFPDDFYWFEHIQEKSMVYFQLNVVFSNPQKDLKTFCEELFQFINEHNVEKLVIDIRLNSGGNNQLNNEIITRILQSDKINKKGNLYVIIGRRTFSAAMNLATNLEQKTNAIFVGEYTGSSPNFVGEDNPITLPKSKLTASASNKYWQDADANDKRKWIEPTYFNVLSFSEYKNNLDPNMQKILELVE
ncbi:MAG: S41 family peptidase [Chitinophagales bacterium]|nr:S41 family peptidase [Chitinophagales bacterium]